ncbi:hypothetical protein ABE185_06830, partial [Aliarcobacter butzleri]
NQSNYVDVNKDNITTHRSNVLGRFSYNFYQFNVRKLSYNKNICNICGNKVDYIFMNYCPCCKNQLKIECKVCNKQTISVLDFCMNCGNNIKE